MELDTYSKQILDQTVAALKGEYAAIPESVKDIMPKAAILIAQGAVAGDLDGNDSRELKHAMAIMANVKVGGQIALNELMLQTATDIIAKGVKFLRGILGV